MKSSEKPIRAAEAIQQPPRASRKQSSAPTSQPSANRRSQGVAQWDGPERRNGQERRQERIHLTEMGQLAASIAHELRQPLGAIRNLTYYLKAKIATSDESLTEKFARLDQQTDLAGRILSNLVAFGRSGTPNKSPFHLDELLKDVLNRISWPPEVRLDQKLSRGLPLICADPLHADRILANLIANALESMEGEGALTIAARSERSSRRGAKHGIVAVDITDTGCGIDPVQGEKLFHPFVSTKSKGTGLGLALSLQLAEANGGSIVFRSQPGQGTTFELRLPAA
jgi:signal transduction histidine kinase